VPKTNNEGSQYIDYARLLSGGISAGNVLLNKSALSSLNWREHAAQEKVGVLVTLSYHAFGISMTSTYSREFRDQSLVPDFLN
jgi:hypothetical protein